MANPLINSGDAVLVVYDPCLRLGQGICAPHFNYTNV